MIIIVEGIDRIGKTTLCEKISKCLNIPVYKYNGIIKYDKMQNNQETDKSLMLLDLVNKLNCDIIFDRSFVTDYVYGIIERNYDVDNANINLDIVVSKMLHNIKSDIVIVYMQPTDIEMSSKQHGKDLLPHSKLFDKAINKIDCKLNKYYSIIGNKINVILYYCNYNDIDKMVDEIILKRGKFK